MRTFKWIAATIVGIVALVAVIGLITTGSAYYSAGIAKVTAGPRVTSQVYGTENIIAKVKLFHDRCTGVKADIAIFQNNYERYVHDKEAAKLETDPLERTAAIEGLVSEQADVTAALNTAQTEAREYNSASAQYTENPFKSQNLPYRIELPAGEEAAAKFQLDCG